MGDGVFRDPSSTPFCALHPRSLERAVGHLTDGRLLRSSAIVTLPSEVKDEASNGAVYRENSSSKNTRAREWPH